MKQRIIGILLTCIILIPIFMLGGLYFDIGLSVLAVLALRELVNLNDNERIVKLLIYISMLFIVLSDRFLGIEKSIIICILINYLPIIFFDKEKYNYNMASNNFAKSLFIGFAFYLFRFYRFEDMWLLLFLVVVASSTDVFAYLIGYFFGKKKFSKISPHKTIEGVISGTLFGVVIGSIFYVFFVDPAASLSIVLLVLILSISGQIGDLLFSQIKRNNDIKDFGNIIIGHGGILDRFDSLIFVTFVYTLISSLF